MNYMPLRAGAYPHVREIMKTWFDIEPFLDSIETLDKASLEEFANVLPPPSQNRAFHHKFDHTKQQILRRLEQIKDEEIKLQKSSNEYWYKKPIGIIFLSVFGGVLVFIIKYFLGF